jgi:hypothetical protein
VDAVLSTPQTAGTREALKTKPAPVVAEAEAGNPVPLWGSLLPGSCSIVIGIFSAPVLHG